MRPRFSIFSKMLITPVIAVMLFTAFLGYTYLHLKQSRQQSLEIQRRLFPVMQLANENRILLDAVAKTFEDAVGAREPAWLENATVTRETIEQNLARLRALLPNEPRFLSGQMRQDFERYFDSGMELSRLLIRDLDKIERIEHLTLVMTGARGVVRASFSDFADEQQAKLLGVFERTAARSQTLLVSGILLGGLSIALMLYVSITLSLATKRSIKGLLRSLTEIAEGKPDFTRRLVQQSEDELGELVRRFNRFTDKLEADHNALIAAKQKAEHAIEVLGETQRIAGLGSWELDVSSQRFRWSEEVFRIAGRDEASEPPSLEGYIECLHPEDRARFRDRIQGAIAGDAYEMELRHLKPDGDYNYAFARARPVFSGKRVVKVQGTVQDLTRLKRAEQAMRNSERQLRLVTDTSPAYIAYVALDTLKYLFVNRRFELALGRRREQIVGRHLREIIGEAAFAYAEPFIAEIRQGRQASYINTFALNGETRWINVHYVPDFDEEGAVRAIVVMGHDITDLKNAEARLRQSEERFRGLFENMIEGVALHEMVHGEDGAAIDYRILDVNPMYETHTGYACAHVIGRLASEVYGSRPPPLLDVYSQVVESGEPTGLELYFEPAHKHFHVSAFSPSPGQFATVFENITDRKQKEEELSLAKEAAEAASRAKSEFLANMSHEIRTPLNAVIGFAELLERTEVDAQQKSYLESIESGGRTLLRLIDDILDLSKVEAGKLRLQPEPMLIRRMFEDVCSIFEPKARVNGLAIRLDIAGEVPSCVLLDEMRMRQVLFNLVGNAIKFTHRGSIAIAVRGEGVERDPSRIRLRIEIRDTGIGIPEHQRQTIFGSFEQQEGQSNRRYGGTGLGLTISRKLVEMMGGEIGLESEMGVGSIFAIVLERVQVVEPCALVFAQPVGVTEVVEFESARVMVVDDIDSNRQLIREMLQDLGLTVVEASNGEQALDLCRSDPPDLILMDILMPGMDGYQVGESLRSMPETSGIPIVAVTASVALSGRLEGIAPLDGMLTKPVNAVELVAELRRFLPIRSVVRSSATNLLGPMVGLERDCDDAVRVEIKGRILPLVRRTMKSGLFDDAQAVADVMREIGLGHGVDALLVLADEVEQAVAGFDTDDLEQVLSGFIRMIESWGEIADA